MKLIYPILKWGSRFFKKGKSLKPLYCNLSEQHRFPKFEIQLSDGVNLILPVGEKKILLVNTASACGFTPQYKELENMYQKYADQLLIIAFPCNQFGNQEQGTDEEIENFCRLDYQISFPISVKTDVKGKNANEIYKWLTDPAKNGWNLRIPEWNFCKYLIDENGFLEAYFPSHLLPEMK